MTRNFKDASQNYKFSVHGNNSINRAMNEYERAGKKYMIFLFIAMILTLLQCFMEKQTVLYILTCIVVIALELIVIYLIMHSNRKMNKIIKEDFLRKDFNIDENEKVFPLPKMERFIIVITSLVILNKIIEIVVKVI